MLPLMLTLALLLAPALGACADAAAAGNTQALAKAQGLLKQVAQAKAQVEGELAKARADLTAKEAQLAALKSDIKAKDGSLSAASADLAASTSKSVALEQRLARSKERLAKTKDKLHEVAAKYKDTALALRETTAARQNLEAALQKTAQALQDAEKKNLALYQTTRELSGLYKKKSAWDAVLQREPLTGLKSVETENLMQEYEDRAAAQLRDGNDQPAGEAAAQP